MDVDEARPVPLDVNTSTAVYADAAVATRVPLTIDMPLLRRPPLLSGAPDVPGVVAALRARTQTSLRCERPYADVNWLAPDEELYKVLLQHWLRLFALQYNAIRRDGGPVLHEAWRFFRQRTLLMSQRVGDAAVRWISQILQIKDENAAVRDDAYTALANYLVEIGPVEPDAGVRLVGELRARVGELEAAVRAQQDALTTALGATGMDVDERSTTALQDLIDERNKARLDYRRLAVVAMLPPPLRPVRLVDTARVAELTAKTTELEATVAAYKRQQQDVAKLRLEEATTPGVARMADLVAKNALLEATVAAFRQRQPDAARTQLELDECRERTAGLAAVTRERDELRAQVDAGAAGYARAARTRHSQFLISTMLPPAPLFRSLTGLVRSSAPRTDVADLSAENVQLKAAVDALKRRASSAAAAALERDEYKQLADTLKGVRAERDELRAQAAAGTSADARAIRAGHSRFLIDAALPSAPLLRSLAAAARASAAEASAAELRIQLDHEKRVVVAKGDEVAAARRTLAAKEAELAEARRAAGIELAAARRELADKEAERAATAQALAATQAQLAAAQRALDANATEREAAIAQRDTAQSGMGTLRAELDDVQRQAAAARRALGPEVVARKEAELQVTELQKINAVARLRIAQWQKNARECGARLLERTQQLDAADEKVRNLEQLLAAAQASDVSAQLDEERQRTRMLQEQAAVYFARLRTIAIDAMLPPVSLVTLGKLAVKRADVFEKELAKRDERIQSLRAQLDGMQVACNQQEQAMST